MAYVDFKSKAIDLVREAVAADNAGKYEDAFKAYMGSLEYFSAHLKYEKNPAQKQSITHKFNEYLTRAEELKKLLQAQKEAVAQPPAQNGNNLQKARGGGGGGGDDKDEDPETAKLRVALGGAILAEKPNVKWDDVSGLDSAKAALKEAVILPVKFPQFFTGKRKAWSGFLLYGPPGTGKSYLAKAVATEADSTFFSVSSSDLVSKWMGESEKLVHQLFQMAHERSPSIIFIDEIDSLCSARGDAGESEAARRIKTEILVQMQGVNNTGGQVLVLAATNTPYNLDQAVRRRFDKRIYIPLPEEGARGHIFKVHLGDTPHCLSEADFADLGRRTAGFSGSDIAVAVKDVLFEPVRKTQEATTFKAVVGPKGGTFYEPCSPGEADAFEATLVSLADQGLSAQVLPPMITRGDFDRVLLRARPTVGAGDLEVHERFTREFGEKG